jgi:hypothetical protein
MERLEKGDIRKKEKDQLKTGNRDKKSERRRTAEEDK